MSKTHSLLAVILAILLVLPAFLDKYLLGIFFMIFFYAYLGQAWNVLTGYTGHISLGHSLYVGMGAYVSTFLAMKYGISPWIGMWAGGLMAAITGMIIGYLGFRFGLRGVYFVILTIAFAEITRLIVCHVPALGGFAGIFLDFRPSLWNLQFRSNESYYYVGLGFMVASAALVRALERSRIGKFMIAVREDEMAAEALGVNAFKYSMIAIALSALMSALAGTLYANYIFYISPNTVMGMALSIELILRPIVGGMGTVLGPIVGSFLLTPLSEFSRAYFARGGLEGLHLILYGLLAIVVVLFMREGILVHLQKFWRRFARE